MIRDATADDLPLVRELWTAFAQEIPDHPWRDEDTDEDLAALDRLVRDEVVLLADDVGLAVASRKSERLGFLDVVYVRPQARRTGVAASLVREAATRLRARGLDMLELEVLASNEAARAIYERWGMKPVELVLAAPLDRLEERLAAEPAGTTFGTVHVQTDDAHKVSENLAKILPRLAREHGFDAELAGSWVRVRADATDGDPAKLQALAKELSYLHGVSVALGVERGAVVRYVLFDNGSMVDEYASVPEFFGELPPGDVIALGANATVVSRLTGADPHRVHEVARTAASPSELPPAQELYRQIAELLGVEVD